MKKTYNTYLSVVVCVNPKYSHGRIYSSVESCKLNLHLDVDYMTSKRELAKLMLRTYKMPNKRVVNNTVYYSLEAFLD